ncbi:hypothetical protein [Paraburkholderia franconis]|nr:hypothetical protein [Paraburkholderia franconis]
MQASLAAAARTREQPVLFAAQVCLKYQVCRAHLPGVRLMRAGRR